VRWVQDSYTLAVPQAAKFAARKTMLQSMKTKAETASAAINTFKPLLDNFLNGPAQTLVAARQNFNATYIAQLPHFIIYGWRDQKPPKNGNRTAGYWHVVRVDAEIPSTLAWVRTWTRGFLGMTRCYALTDYNGVIKTTVTRWDEDHDPLAFANHLPIWRAVFHKPGTSDTPVQSLDTACAGSVTPESPTFSGWNAIGVNPNTLTALINIGTDNSSLKALEGAFMFNADPAGGSGAQCWSAVNTLLGRGVSSKTCAQYYGGSGAHMQIRFTPCS